MRLVSDNKNTQVLNAGRVPGRRQTRSLRFHLPRDSLKLAKVMVQALKLFAEGISSGPSRSAGAAIRIRYLGSQWSELALKAFSALGWEASQHTPDSRLEFFSLPRESHDGVFLEELPAKFSGDLVQRFLAASFLGLRPHGVLFIGFRDHPPEALLAWLRQAGFQALQQGQAEGLSGILARRLG